LEASLSHLPSTVRGVEETTVVDPPDGQELEKALSGATSLLRRPINPVDFKACAHIAKSG
jgi:hypothetical protein